MTGPSLNKLNISELAKELHNIVGGCGEASCLICPAVTRAAQALLNQADIIERLLASGIPELRAENELLQSRVKMLERRAGALLQWWPEGSENGTAAANYGVGFRDDLLALRAALNPQGTTNDRK